MNKRMGFFLAVLGMGFVLAMACGPAAAGDPPVIPGSCWDLDGTWKVPGGKGWGYGDACFGPRTGLPSNRYEMLFSDGYDPIEVIGTYELVKGKLKTMTVDSSALLAELKSLMRPYGVDVSRIDKASMKCKANASKKKGELLKVQFATKFVATVEGRSAKVSMKWKMVGGRSTAALWSNPAASPAGVSSIRAALMHAFEAGNAEITEAEESPEPRPGNTVVFELQGRPHGAFQAALSLGTAGIDLGASGTVPLSFDELCQLSLIGAFPHLSGTLDASGEGTVRVAIPNSPGLIGQSFYCAFINTDPIDHVSNALRVTIG